MQGGYHPPLRFELLRDGLVEQEAARTADHRRFADVGVAHVLDLVAFARVAIYERHATFAEGVAERRYAFVTAGFTGFRTHNQ